MRFGKWLCIVLGAGFLIIAGVTGVLAARAAGEVSVYDHAGVCLARASPTVDCRQPVIGAVTGVVENGGKSPDYALDVQTSAGPMQIAFPSDSAMLSYAVDGNPAIVTMWRGIPVAVTTDGRTEATAAVPDTALARNLGECAQAGGVGVFFLLGGLAIRRNRMVGPRPITRPAVAAAALAVVLGALVVTIGGFALGGKASRVEPVLIGIGAGLAVVAGLSAWLGLAGQRRNRANLPVLATDLAAPATDPSRATVPATPAIDRAGMRTRRGLRTGRTQAPLRMRLHPGAWLPMLRRSTAPWAALVLTVAVLLAVLATAQDGPPARAYRHAPACAGETNLATCVGDFMAVINGVRTPAQGSGNYADVSYVTADGVINTWATFDGDSASLARAAAADEAQRTPLTIKVWRGEIVGADLHGSWHWPQGDPPGVAIPAAFLAVSLGLLLLFVRVRVHRRIRSRGSGRRRVLLDDLGQVVAAAGAIVLLAFGFWPAAFLVLVVLAWLGLSARRARKVAAFSWQ